MTIPPNMELGVLCRFAGLRCPPGAEQVVVSGITEDSRVATAGMLFVAVPGTRVDGHDFIGQAVANGCAAVLVRDDAGGQWPVPVIRVADTGRTLGLLAAALYGFPGGRMRMIGITGTNGKTTSSYLLESIIRAGGGEPGVIGTVAVRFAGQDIPAALTTPRPVELQKILWRMAEAGVTHVVMEVSSHALVQERINGLQFDVALFTNISRDHLDFHRSMESYFLAKTRLFADYLKPDGRAVVVLDAGRGSTDQLSGWSGRLIELLHGQGRHCLSCGIGAGDVCADRFQFDLRGISAEVRGPGGRMVLTSPLVGEFNLRNILGVVGCALALAIAPETIRQAVASCQGAPGRLERVVGRTEEVEKLPQAAVFVDYAHTPDALEKVLVTLRQLKPKRLIVVFGCGGDRDRGKRPLMGGVAIRLADVVVVTSDNPRSEEPGKILAEIAEGVVENGGERIAAAQLMLERNRRGYDVIEDRAEAIRVAVRGAAPGDVVLISGKGHECYQIIGNRRLDFDDRQQARHELQRAGKAA